MSQWTPNDHLFTDSISPSSKHLLTNQSNNSNTISPVTSLANELDYISLDQQDFPQMFSYQRQSTLDRDYLPDMTDPNSVRIQGYQRQSAQDKNLTPEISDVASSRSLNYQRPSTSEKNYVPDISDAGSMRSVWNNQYSDQCGIRTDNILADNPESGTQSLRTEPVTTSQDLPSSQYPWLVNRWTCF